MTELTTDTEKKINAKNRYEKNQPRQNGRRKKPTPTPTAKPKTENEKEKTSTKNRNEKKPRHSSPKGGRGKKSEGGAEKRAVSRARSVAKGDETLDTADDRRDIMGREGLKKIKKARQSSPEGADGRQKMTKSRRLYLRQKPLFFLNPLFFVFSFRLTLSCLCFRSFSL